MHSCSVSRQHDRRERWPLPHRPLAGAAIIAFALLDIRAAPDAYRDEPGQ